ncbi:MAG TPA: TetR/AcrR family transcriptional regulator [Anaerolineaceae bacterium]|nr:TetR/AcrR family transcriptional regulator [Anaerolineaceae bacterium]
MTIDRPNKGEATSERIIEVAYQLFIEQGYHATSMRQIGDRAGITMGGIYNHFTSKEAIWKAVLIAKHPYREIMPLLQNAQGDTIAEFMDHAADSLIKELGERTDLLNLMFIEMVEFNAIHLIDIFNTIQPELVKLAMVFNQKKGKLRPISAPIIARSFVGLFISYYITGQILPEPVLRSMGNDSLKTFVDIYLHGILDSEAPDYD